MQFPLSRAWPPPSGCTAGTRMSLFATSKLMLLEQSLLWKAANAMPLAGRSLPSQLYPPPQYVASVAERPQHDSASKTACATRSAICLATVRISGRDDKLPMVALSFLASSSGKRMQEPRCRTNVMKSLRPAKEALHPPVALFWERACKNFPGSASFF